MKKIITDFTEYLNRKNKFHIRIILFVFLIIYSLISLVNHYLFRTYALDLGIYTHAIYSFSHLKINYFTLDISGAEFNFFGGDHFSPILIFISPLYFLFKSYTLLIVQIFAILFGGYGVYKYSKEINKNKFSTLIMLHFFGLWGIYSALSFDFHCNVIAAMLVPWFIFYCIKENKFYAIIFFILIIASKENMAIWIVFILFGLIIKKGIQNWKKYIKLEIPLLLIALIYFVLVVGIIMPYLRHGEGSDQLSRYAHFGNSVSTIFFNLIKNPKYIFSLLFESTLPDPIYFGIKSELHFMVLISGGITFLYRPYFFVMLMPIYLQKLIHNEFHMWGINGQYSIEFAPILSICLSEFTANILSKKQQLFWIGSILFLTYFYTIKTFDGRRSIWFDNQNVKFYSSKHYKADLDFNNITNILNKIPDNVPVSAHNALIPRLVSRDKIYHFPIIKDAQYIVLLNGNQRGSYPLIWEEYLKAIHELYNSNSFSIFIKSNELIVFKRNNEILKQP